MSGWRWGSRERVRAVWSRVWCRGVGAVCRVRVVFVCSPEARAPGCEGETVTTGGAAVVEEAA
eukprot:2430916-Prorocentrum_lima.AAC.1